MLIELFDDLANSVPTFNNGFDGIEILSELLIVDFERSQRDNSVSGLFVAVEDESVDGEGLEDIGDGEAFGGFWSGLAAFGVHPGLHHGNILANFTPFLASLRGKQCRHRVDEVLFPVN